MTETTTTAETAPAVDPAVEKARLAEFGRQIVVRRLALKLGRNALAGLTGMTGAQIWRAEDGRARAEEEIKIEAALSKCETDGIPEELRRKTREPNPRVAVLEDKLRRIDELLAMAMGARTRKECEILVGQAQLVISGNEPETDTEAEAAAAETEEPAE